MSVIFDMFRSSGSRSANRARTRKAQEEAILSPQALRTRWYRCVLAVILASIVLGVFVEVVLLPGKLVRRHFQSFGSEMGTDATPFGSDFKLPFGLQTEAQKVKQTQAQDDRMQQRLRSVHEQLDQSYQKLLAARDSLQSYCQTRLGVAPDVSAGSMVPKTLVDVIANEQTAQLAWSQLLQAMQQAGEHLKGSHELLDSVAAHFTAGSFLAEDEHDMIALLDGMNRSLSDVVGSRDDVDHIATLRRGRAALAHQPPTEDNPRNPP